MIHLNPFGETPIHGAPSAPASSSFLESVASVALGALAILMASAFDRTNPGLAVVLRCVVGGIGLVWLFNRCCPEGETPARHYHHPIPTPIYARGSDPFNYGGGWTSTNRMYEAPHSRPVYVTPPGHQRVPPFPNVVQSPTWQSREPFPNVIRTSSAQGNHPGNSVPLFEAAKTR